MDVKIINKDEDSLEIQILGEGHTLCTNLKQILFEDNSVKFAGYMIKHPLMAEPRFYIKTDKSKTPRQALLDACKVLEKRCDEFRELLNKAIKEFK